MFFLDPRTARAAWTALVFLIVGGLAYVLRHFVLLVAFSLLFAYLIFPLVRLAQRWLPLGRRRTGAIAVVYAALLLALTGTGLLVGPRLTREVQGR